MPYHVLKLPNLKYVSLFITFIAFVYLFKNKSLFKNLKNRNL